MDPIAQHSVFSTFQLYSLPARRGGKGPSRGGCCGRGCGVQEGGSRGGFSGGAGRVWGAREGGGWWTWGAAGFFVQGIGCGVQGLGFKVQSFGFRMNGSGLMAWDLRSEARDARVAPPE